MPTGLNKLVKEKVMNPEVVRLLMEGKTVVCFLIAISKTFRVDCLAT